MKMTWAKTRTHIRWMIRRDMPHVLDIANGSMTPAPDEEWFLQQLRHRNVIGMVAEVGEDIRGYMIYELAKTYLEISTLAVSPRHRHESVGTQMLDKLKSKLSSHRRNCLQLTVPESNLDTQLFLRVQGFKAVKVLRGYFNETHEDGYEFAYHHQGE